MPDVSEIREHRELPYSAQQIYDLVADVAAYPEFLPWTLKARLRNQTPHGFDADLVMGFQFMRETFTSHVSLFPNEYRVHAEGIGKGPFSKLVNNWHIQPLTDTSCTVDFMVEYVIRNFALRRVIEPIYVQAQKQVMGAFQSRAEELYRTF